MVQGLSEYTTQQHASSPSPDAGDRRGFRETEGPSARTHKFTAVRQAGCIRGFGWNTRMLSDPKGFGGDVGLNVLGHHDRPPNCQLCTSMSAYRSGVKMARAVSGSGARSNAAVPSHVAPLSDSSGP